MKKAVLLILGFLACAAAPCQNTVDVTPEYFARQYVKLQKAFVEDPDDVETNLLLARFYSQADNPMRNLPLAMVHVKRADSVFVAVVSDPSRSKEGRKLVKKQLNVSTIRNQKQQIVALARKDADSPMLSETEKEAYINAFATDPVIPKQIKKNRLQEAYATACAANSVEAYDRFIANYPGTTEAEKAEASIAKLAPNLFDGMQSIAEVDSVASHFPSSPAVQRQAEKCKSRIAFAAASEKHTLQGYKEFIAEHPSGDEYPMALEALDNLRAIQFQRLSSAEDYANFIADNGDDPLAEKALEALRQMVAKDHDARAAKIYLKRFPLDPQHSSLFQNYYGWVSSEGNRQPIATFAQEYPEYPFRTQVERDLLQADKIDAYPLLSPFVEADYERYANFVRMNSEKRIAFVALQRTLQRLCAQRNWKSALARMDNLELAFDNDNKSAFKALRNIVATPPDKRTQRQYESSPSDPMIHPVPHPDGQHLYYTLLGVEGQRICVSARSHSKKGARWTLGEPVTFVNVENKGLTLYGFYDHGKRMVLGKDGDIWFAVREGASWRVTEMPSYPLNTDYYEGDATMLPDGSGLLMASDRPTGYNFQPSRSNFHGDTALATDLYYVPLTAQGWGTPINLGHTINTCYAERSPILSRNLKTLYFVSDGHSGLGYGDIFMAQRDDVDNWTSWSQPRNLGREANSGFDEGSVAFSHDEARLFIASNAAGRYGCYSVGTLHDTLLNHRMIALNVASLKGQLTHVDLCDADHLKVRQTINYPSSDTLYIPLAKGRRYVLMAYAHDQFVPAVSLLDDTVAQFSLQGYTIEQLLTLREALPLDLVTFEKQSPQMTSRSTIQLDQLVEFMKEQPRCRVVLRVDVSGRDDARCYALAMECGQTLRRYLLSQGISQERIGVAAYGNTNCRSEKGKKIGVSLTFSEIQ